MFSLLKVMTADSNRNIVRVNVISYVRKPTTGSVAPDTNRNDVVPRQKKEHESAGQENIRRKSSKLYESFKNNQIQKKTTILLRYCTVPPVLSTCPLHTNSGCGKERRILIGSW